MHTSTRLTSQSNGHFADRFQQFVLLLTLFALLTFNTSVLADSLTDRHIRAFIASMEELKTIEDELKEFELDEDDGLEGMPSMAQLVENMRDYPVYGRVETAVKKHGFSSVDAWAVTADRVIRAVISVHMEAHQADYRMEMMQLMEDLDSNPHMSAQQRQQMRDMIMQGQEWFDEFGNAPDADRRAIQPHLQRLIEVLELDIEDPDD
ncbi:MAG: hypothetical protein JJU10_11340 [Idiomarina sp.]|nr:hypothetical protein [Idiomarina sp.]